MQLKLTSELVPDSGKITVANIKVTLGQGDYVLVFSNMYSAITPKAVEAHVALDW